MRNGLLFDKNQTLFERLPANTKKVKCINTKVSFDF